ncbi:hypothetical protein F5882DRAFT_402159 [Hyaloscypha sp. PMI_1271]|nr:hypothetical protein F5882DRAFT_402159 [Hyaloscypha sp. PMI_1271]
MAGDITVLRGHYRQIFLASPSREHMTLAWQFGTLVFLTSMLSTFHFMDWLLFYWRCVRAAVALDQAYEARSVLLFRT